jgi:hypothetical protein
VKRICQFPKSVLTLVAVLLTLVAPWQAVSAFGPATAQARDCCDGGNCSNCKSSACCIKASRSEAPVLPKSPTTKLQQERIELIAETLNVFANLGSVRDEFPISFSPAFKTQVRIFKRNCSYLI